jgi:hypothetical protein
VKELSKKMLSFNGLKGKSSPETMAQNCEEDLVTTLVDPSQNTVVSMEDQPWIVYHTVYLQLHRLSCLKNRYPLVN